MSNYKGLKYDIFKFLATLPTNGIYVVPMPK